jgi:colanic acid biosynthesis protein WcaH
MKLDSKQFIELIKNAPLVAIDFIVLDKENNVLLGKRINEPAKDFWFVPGGRVRKDEFIGNASKRISKDEFGVELEYESIDVLPIAEHFYNVNYYDLEDVSTHYIVIPKVIRKTVEIDILPFNQHKQYCWFDIQDALTNIEVHKYPQKCNLITSMFE